MPADREPVAALSRTNWFPKRDLTRAFLVVRVCDALRGRHESSCA